MLAVTMGEPAGVGGELTLMAWARRRRGEDVPAFLALDDPERLAALAARLGLPVVVQPIAEAAEARAVTEALPVLPVPLATPVQPGHPDAANASAVLASIERAVRLAQVGEVDAIVTQPIHKGALYAAGFQHPGHTEFLAALCDAPLPVMMLVIEALRVVPITIHLPLRQAIDALTTPLIEDTAKVVAAALRRDFGVAAPRLACAGLNPHAGEGGGLGREEIEIMAPALKRLREAGITISGPHPADSLFHATARAGYDAALCPTHDQALIPVKTLDFERGVNVTLGLPILRTSPDHGTAFDIAGSGRASPLSFIEALRLARRMADQRARVT